jgi:hypothetical protein
MPCGCEEPVPSGEEGVLSRRELLRHVGQDDLGQYVELGIGHDLDGSLLQARNM